MALYIPYILKHPIDAYRAVRDQVRLLWRLHKARLDQASLLKSVEAGERTLEWLSSVEPRVSELAAMKKAKPKEYKN